MIGDERDHGWRDLGAFIREQRRVGQMSLRKLSEQSGISNPYLSQIERGLRRPSADILQQIARALEISSETLYVRAGILEERDLDHDVVAEVRRDPDLTEEQKTTMIHIYRSFRTANAATEALLDAGVTFLGPSDAPAEARSETPEPPAESQTAS